MSVLLSAVQLVEKMVDMMAGKKVVWKVGLLEMRMVDSMVAWRADKTVEQ